jgi:hypothetical protein
MKFSQLRFGGLSFRIVLTGAIPVDVALLHGFVPELASSMTPSVNGAGSLFVQDENPYKILGCTLSKDRANRFQIVP